jgi:hypothetical protein
MHKKPSQTKQILEHLEKGNTISPIDALNMFGCLRLGARIYELRHGKYDGKVYEIEEVPHEGKQYSVYKLKTLCDKSQ